MILVKLFIFKMPLTLLVNRIGVSLIICIFFKDKSFDVCGISHIWYELRITLCKQTMLLNQSFPSLE